MNMIGLGVVLASSLLFPAGVFGQEGEWSCGPVEFVETIDVAEASGAAYFEMDGVGYVLVTSDSGGGGEARVLSLVDGSSSPVMLPLGEMMGDDIEGLTARDNETVVGITSSGYLRHWHRDGLEFELVETAYSVSDRSGFTCERPAQTNCEKNYEGLCLHPDPSVLVSD